MQGGRSLWYDGYQQIKFPAGQLIRNLNNNTVMDWRDANGNPVECVLPSACNTVEVPTQGCPHGSSRSSCIWNGGCDSLPFFPLPPSGEGKGSGLPIYGKWCGPGHPPKSIRDYEKPYPEPDDYLDGCCKDHDKCYDDNNCVGWCWLTSLQCRICDCILAGCALSTDCSSSPQRARCERMKPIIGGHMLIQGGCFFLPKNPIMKFGGNTGSCLSLSPCAR